MRECRVCPNACFRFLFISRAYCTRVEVELQSKLFNTITILDPPARGVILAARVEVECDCIVPCDLKRELETED